MEETETLRKLKEFLKQHSSLMYEQLISPEERPASLVGVNGIHLLLKLLERSNDLLHDSIEAHRGNRTLLLYLTVRAHYETTANLCFFLKNLRQFYQQEIDDNKINEVIKKLSVGGRDKPEWHGILEVPDPISIMSAIDSVDDLLKKAGTTEKIIRSSYDFISEFCHPNFFGAAYKTKVDLESGTVTFLTDSESFKIYSQSARLKLLISCNVFLTFYKEAFSVLEKNEIIPTLVRRNRSKGLLRFW